MTVGSVLFFVSRYNPLDVCISLSLSFDNNNWRNGRTDRGEAVLHQLKDKKRSTKRTTTTDEDKRTWKESTSFAKQYRCWNQQLILTLYIYNIYKYISFLRDDTNIIIFDVDRYNERKYLLCIAWNIFIKKTGYISDLSVWLPTRHTLRLCLNSCLSYIYILSIPPPTHGDMWTIRKQLVWWEGGGVDSF